MSSSAASPSAGQALVGVATVAAGVTAAYFASQRSDQLIDYSIAKASNAYMAACYGASDVKPRGLLDRSVVGFSKWIDQSALALEWKSRQMQFDDTSPIKSTTIVTCVVGLLAALLTKKAINVAMR